MQKIQIIGRVGKDAVVNNYNGQQVANFSVAVGEKINGQEHTTWYDVSLWERPKIFPYIRKGGLIYVEGKPSINIYKKHDGATGASLRVSAYQIELLGGTGEKNSQEPMEANKPEESFNPNAAEDLPF